MARRKKEKPWSCGAPLVLCLLTLVAVLLFANLHVQIGNFGSSRGSNLRGDFDRFPLNSIPLVELTHKTLKAKEERRLAKLAQDPKDEFGRLAKLAQEKASNAKSPVSMDLGRDITAPKPAKKSLLHQPVVVTTVGPDTPAMYRWPFNSGASCQNYAGGDSTSRTLEASKIACVANSDCAAIECNHGHVDSCSLRAVANKVPYESSDCYEKIDKSDVGSPSFKLHPEYNNLLKHYSFQQVTTQNGQQVNIILVRAPFRSPHDMEMYKKCKDEILFMAISSFEDFPLDAMNPYSGRFANDYWTGMFPGFLHMMHDPEKWFPTNVKTILMSQSDFNLPSFPARDYTIPRKYDFTLSGSDQDVYNDCVGWSSYAKNWSFVKQSLSVMCEMGLKGVLVATKTKDGRKACTIPDNCKGKMIQTTFLDQNEYFGYLKQSRFAYLPQVHDASPRVSTQALSLDVPLLMNSNIKGGWKYLNEKTGEFFHDMSNFRQSLEKILKGADIPYHYEPRKWVLENYGNANSGPRLLKFVKDNFAGRDNLFPTHTRSLFT